jgi:hypothetical protein
VPAQHVPCPGPPKHASPLTEQHRVIAPTVVHVRPAQHVSVAPVHVAPPVRQGAHWPLVGPAPLVLQTPVQHGSGVPTPQAVPCPMQEPGTRQVPSIHAPVQQFRDAQLSPMLAQSVARQVPSPQKPEQHCVSVVQAWVSEKQQPLRSSHSRL